MALSAGTHLGSYEIHSPLGVGGMGEVYRARDTKLDRDVAIKILPDSFAHDGDRLARFRREAQVLAALNDPHIGAIYGLEEASGHQFLVLELVDGETLADRIAQGPVSLEDALPIAKQIAEALAAAHEHGIVHRDLKPANIKLRPDGVVKVLDFGLAKATGASPASEYTLANSPTLTSPAMMTGLGVILGTATYMSPEQAKGRPVDKRSDVWAFGCVLYEMLTGRRAFKGDDVSDTLAMVLKGEPDWDALPSNVPHAVRTLIQGCLRKDRKERIGDISTALFVLGQPREASALVSHPRPSPVWRRAMLVVAGVLIGAAIAAAMLWKRGPSPAVPVTRFAFTLPEGQQLTVNRGPIAISPDGTRIVYAAEGRLYLRSMSGLEARAIPGAEPAITPAFSPDGQSLVFWSDSRLKRIGVSGGPAVTIFQTGSSPTGITWGNDGILFSPMGTAIMRVSPSGGKPEVLLDLNNSDDWALSPQLLPDGGTLLFTIMKRPGGRNIDPWDESQIVVQRLDTGVRKTVISGGSDARYVPTGHIVYVSGGTLFAVPFDLPKLEVTGGAVPVVEGVRRGNYPYGMAHFAFSNSGSLVYGPGSSSPGQQRLVLFDRKGGTEPLEPPAGRYAFPRVSPDGKRIVFETNEGKEAVVSIYELSGASSVRRLTFGGNNRYPIWSADGLRVTFQSDRAGDSAVFWQPANGGTEERLTKPEPGMSHIPESWSPDGEVLLFSATKGVASSLWTFSLRDRKETPFSDVKGSALPPNAMFSPDGRWVAYQVGEIGVTEGTTYVQPFPATGTKYQIARGGRPLWSRDGKELFFVPASDRFMVVTVRTAPSFTFTSPVSVPRGFGVATPASPRPFDVMPDGRFVGVGPQGQSSSGPAQIHVVLNWFEELKARAPTK